MVCLALTAAGALAAIAGRIGGPGHALLALIGVTAGIALYHASFGFTSAWRRFILEKRTVGLRAQLVMVACACTVFFPLLANDSALGLSLYGFVNPIGLALCIGAFLFGIGMQLGGGCGSGTLYTAGGGSLRMLVTLTAFVAGSLIATADPGSWSRWPSLGAVSIVEAFGSPVAVLLMLATLGLTYALALRIEREHHGDIQPLGDAWPQNGNVVPGPWPLLTGAFALVAVNVATLLVAGRPWGITSAFALWGAKAAQAAGIDVAQWAYWKSDGALAASVLADVTTVMNLGLMLGALAAAGAAGRFAPSARVPWPSVLAAVLGGLLMGFGARLATGCNIGAFFSGIASGSLHGAIWLLAAIPGNLVGVRLRRAFGL